MTGILMSQIVPENNAVSIEKIIQQHNIVLFDALCVLCHGWTKFLIKNDIEARFKLCSVQSDLGQAILEYYQMPTDHFDTMLVVKNGDMYTESTAFLKVIEDLRLPFSSLKIGYLMPRLIRDFLYRRVALNRYRLFRKMEYCALPSADNKHHFLENFIDANA